MHNIFIQSSQCIICWNIVAIIQKHQGVCGITIETKSMILRILDLPLINCEVELDLLWKQDCVLIEHHNNITGVDFTILSFLIF